MVSPLLAMLVTLYIAHQALSQDSSQNAACLQGYDWMKNSKGQDPCEVAAYLEGPCDVQPISELPPLGSNEHYINPDSSPCDCNTPFYSIISACAICQGALILEWQFWSSHCSQTGILKYPFNIPSGTAIPSWAYLDVVASERFNATEAWEVVNGTIPAPQVPPSATSSSTSTEGAPTSAAASGAVETSNKTPVIAGVVGGVGGALLVAGILFAIYRFLRSRKPYPGRTQGHTSIISAPSPCPTMPTFAQPVYHEKMGSIDAAMASTSSQPSNTLGLNYSTIYANSSGTATYSPLPTIPTLNRTDSFSNLNTGRTTPTSVKSATYPHSLYYNGLPQV